MNIVKKRLRKNISKGKITKEEAEKIMKEIENEERFYMRYTIEGVGDWFVLKEEKPGYYYGYVDLIEKEWGYFTIEGIEELGAVRDENFYPWKINQMIKLVSLF